ncbi:MAG: sporulation integral membrane protein YlbJ [Clostridia bacterium]|nr:sporulation integral membrane protein YlbJ [Clostridia bacterium]
MHFSLLSPKDKQAIGFLLRLAVPVLLGIVMILFPENIFPAAKRGIDSWWHVVFPGLFPFFVISELMFQFGVVHFLSVFLEPVMRPLFNVPGAGALVLAAGYTSGAPIGGVMTAHLKERHLVDQEEAARLVAFTNNASPLFMLSSISIGFLNLPQAGWLLATGHYAANLLVGILLKRLSPKKERLGINYSLRQLFLLGLSKMEQAGREAAKPLGHLLGDATKKAMQNILVVGGFIISFSVLIEIMSIMGLLGFAGNLLELVLQPLGLDPNLAVPLASGMLEMTIGIKMVSESKAPLLQQLICISLLLGWAGLAVHAQVAAFISAKGISLVPYYLARISQGLLAAIFTFLLGWTILPGISLEVLAPETVSAWDIALNSIKTMFLLLALLLSISVLLTFWQRLLRVL